MPYRHLIILALFAGLPVAAQAQFTTFIPPQAKMADSAKSAVVAQQKAQADSVTNLQIADMKTWVDSAAGVAMPPATTADSLARAGVSGAATPSTPATTDTTTPTLRNGARAPATASDLPLLALIGMLSLFVGTVMLAGTQLGRTRA
jgi:hypothetical protein